MAASPKVARRDLKEDKVYLTIAEVAAFLARNRLWIAMGGLIALVAFALTYFVHARSQRVAAEASWALYQANRQEDTSEKMAALEEITAEYRRTAAGRLASFELANALYNDGRYEEAMKRFQEFLKKNPNHLLAPAALEATGYCQESLGLWAEAIKTYQSLITRHAGNPASARSHYRLGLCYEETGEKEKAIQAYEKTVELVPETVWSEYAMKRLDSIRPSVRAKEEAHPEAAE